VTVVLCGGKGTRAYPHTAQLPKPLLDVAGRPVLEHVLDIYARQGARRFVLAAGFQSDMIRSFAGSLMTDWDVQVVDTGEDANTATRIFRCKEYLGERFFATYGDGVGNVDLAALLRTHASAGTAATITTVPLPSQYGTVDSDAEGKVRQFTEKPRLRDHWINGGFFVMERRVFEHWSGEDLEKEVLPYLASLGELQEFRHEGFWRSMDTYKDSLELSALAGAGTPPWLASPTAEIATQAPSGVHVGATYTDDRPACDVAANTESF
jgi:glucose-1-phosphate cytidylyltransferase